MALDIHAGRCRRYCKLTAWVFALGLIAAVGVSDCHAQLLVENIEVMDSEAARALIENGQKPQAEEPGSGGKAGQGDSALGADDVLTVGADHVAIATGATWRRDGFGRLHPKGIADAGPAAHIFTPDDVMAGRMPAGRVVVFDDDHYYMAAVIAERISAEAASVTLITTEDMAAAWSNHTSEQTRTQRRLLQLGVEIVTAHGLMAYDGGEALFACRYTGRERRIAADSVVLITARRPNDELYLALSARMDAGSSGTDGLPKTLRRIGDCEAPAIIAAAVYAGHHYARELDNPEGGNTQVPHDRVFEEML